VRDTSNTALNSLKPYNRVKNVLNFSSYLTEYLLHLRYKDQPVNAIVGPANQNGCIILRVGNLADEKF
jgi:hypothetical protein